MNSTTDVKMKKIEKKLGEEKKLGRPRLEGQH